MGSRLEASLVERSGPLTPPVLGHRERRGLFVGLRDRDGHRGVGEASPLPGYGTGTLEATVRTLRELLPEVAARAEGALAPACSASPGDGAVEAAVATALSPHEARLRPDPWARFALETALLDLVGRRTGRSVSACLAGDARQRSVPRSALLLPGPALLERAQALVARGVLTLKLKLGRAAPAPELEELRALRAALPARAAPAPELEELRALRAALPATVVLRLDANGAFDAEEARRRIEQLAALAPALVEEPCCGKELLTLGPCALPWAADESLALPGLAAPLLLAPGCSAVVLKPGPLGGILAARRLALAAHRRGLGVIVTHTLDGPVALAAACELALSLPFPPLACGLDLHPALAAFPLATPPQLCGPEAELVGGPWSGLGLEARWIP